MNLLQQLREKPWIQPAGPVVALRDGSTFYLPAATLGLRVFMVVVTVVFSLLLMAYGTRMAFEDWRPAPELRLLWLNTALLVGASVAMQWARGAATRGNRDTLAIAWLVGGICSIGFLVGQLQAWRQLQVMPSFNVVSPAIGFFYLITGVHAVHLLGGLVAWIRTALKLWRGTDLVRLRLSVRLCTAYWHFLLVVWLILFGLLFSGNDNLQVILVFCGIK